MTNSVRSIPRSSRFTGGLCALAFAAGCSSQSGLNPISPSTAVGASGATAAGAGPTVRYYTAQISPTAVAAASSHSYSVTVTNDNSTTSSQTMKSATIVVPAGFSLTPGFVVSATGGKSWSASLVSSTIQLVKNNNDQLATGESVTVTFSATAPSLGPCANQTYEWTTVGYNGSDFTTPYTRKGPQPSVTVTADCPSSCTYGMGAWKTHHPDWPASVLTNGLTLGTVSYTAAQLDSIFAQPPVAGNGLVSLAHHLIAAKLNIANGAAATAISSTIVSVDALIGSLAVPPVGGGSLTPAAVEALKDALENYNEGLTGPGKCTAAD